MLTALHKGRNFDEDVVVVAPQTVSGAERTLNSALPGHAGLLHFRLVF